MADSFTVEVAYALPDEQRIVEVEAASGITLREAVQKSGIRAYFPEIDPDNDKMGIWGKVARPDTELHAGDRVEIYRPLIADPKEARKKRAAQGKVMKKGARDANASDA